MVLFQRLASVREVIEERDDYQALHCKIVSRSGQLEAEFVKAINYPSLSGYCEVGDQVLLNGTAQALQLGTGGYDFVRLRLPTKPSADFPLQLGVRHEGHIMKLRYTPSQLAVHTWEEQEGAREEFLRGDAMVREVRERTRTPVQPTLVFSLHSMLPLLCILLKERLPHHRIAYIMTDGSALPLALSQHVWICKQRGLLDLTITCGHAFGGDVETVTLYSAILAARSQADLILIGDGPGVVGTNTKWGTTGLLPGTYLNAAFALDASPILVPRIQGGDQRKRHRGISHHTLTILSQLTPFSLQLYWPEASWLHAQGVSSAQLEEIEQQIAWIEERRRARQFPPHQWVEVLLPSYSWLQQLLSTYPLAITTMGRDVADDPLFLATIMATAEMVASLLLESRQGSTGKDEENGESL